MIPETWIDLEPYGLHLELLKVPSGRHYLVVGGDFSPEKVTAIESVGLYMAAPSSIVSGKMYRAAEDDFDLKYMVKRLLKVLPQSMPRPFDAVRDLHDISGGPTATTDAAPSSVDAPSEEDGDGFRP